MSQQQVTHCLKALRRGDTTAMDELAGLVYDDLRKLAGQAMASERRGHTLQPTALANEAFVRLVQADVDWQDRAHFFAVAAGQIRRILVDYARKHRSLKRGGDRERITLTGLSEASVEVDVVDVHLALEELEAKDPDGARLIELFHFGGLGYAEIAEITGSSARTVSRQLERARTWLRFSLERDNA